MTIEDYAKTLPATTNGADRIAVGLEYAFGNYSDLLERLADGPDIDPPDNHPEHPEKP